MRDTQSALEARENGTVNLDPTRSATDLAALDAARRDFPSYQIDVELTLERPRYVARRAHPGPGPHTLITSDLAELRTELGASRQASPQDPHG
jgi:hypothetical protein